MLEAASKTQLGLFTPKIGRTNKTVITSMTWAPQKHLKVHVEI